MTLDYGVRQYAYDTVEATFDFNTVQTTDDPSKDVWWDAQRSVDATDVPSYYTDFFDTDRYYAIDTIVTRETPQKYVIGDEEYTFIKPNEELRKATWSLDNSPYTLSHPDEGAVRSTDDIHGFWGQPRHDDDEKATWATLYFPTDDTEAREFVANTDNVSVGFVNTLKKSDRDGVDAEQTEIVYDHIASVEHGRCSDEDGCGLQNFSTRSFDTTDPTDSSTVTDDNINTNTDSTMQCNDCGNDVGSNALDFGLEDFGVRKIRTENDAVDDELQSLEDEVSSLEDERDKYESEHELLTSLADDFDADDGEELVSELQSLQDNYKEIQSEMEDRRTDERDELLTEVKERTDSEYHDRFTQGDDESVSEHIDRLEDKIETMNMVKGDSSPTTVTSTDSRETETSGESDFDSTVGATISGAELASVSFDD